MSDYNFSDTELQEIHATLSGDTKKDSLLYRDSQWHYLGDNNAGSGGYINYDLLPILSDTISLKDSFLAVPVCMGADTDYKISDGTHKVALKYGSPSLFSGCRIEMGSTNIENSTEIWVHKPITDILTTSQGSANQDWPFEQKALDDATGLTSNGFLAKAALLNSQATVQAYNVPGIGAKTGVIRTTLLVRLSSISDFLKQLPKQAGNIINQHYKFSFQLSRPFGTANSNFNCIVQDATSAAFANKYFVLDVNGPNQIRLYYQKITMNGPTATSFAAELAKGVDRVIKYRVSDVYKISNTATTSVNQQVFQSEINPKRFYAVGMAADNGLANVPLCYTTTFTNTELLVNNDRFDSMSLTQPYEFYKKVEELCSGYLSKQENSVLNYTNFLTCYRIHAWNLERMGRRISSTTPVNFLLKTDTANSGRDIFAICEREQVCILHVSDSAVSAVVQAA